MKPAKILLFFVLLSLISSFTPLLSAAQDIGPWYNQNPQQFREKVMSSPEDEIFGERYTFAQVNWIINSLYTAFAPPPDESTLKKLIQDILDYYSTGAEGPLPLNKFAQLGVPGLLVGGTAEIMSNPPASGIESINGALANFSLVSPAHAQAGGVGFSSLNGVQMLWKASRNMAYFLTIILLIASGFMIMFRVKINPQTVVSLQTMIPKLIITLILITFSYAIAGLVIDLAYVIIVLLITSLKTFGVFTGASGGIGETIKFFTGGYSSIVGFFIIPLLALLAAGAVVAWIPFVGIYLGTLMAVVSVLLMLFFAWTLFKIWWMMLKTYITLLILIIVGPWQIMLDLIPGQSGFSSWFRNIIAQASVFVVVPAMFIMTMVFWDPYLVLNKVLDTFATGFLPLGAITPGSGPFPSFPLMAAKGGLFGFMIGYATLALIPKAAEMVRDALKVPAFKYGAAFGETLAPIGLLAGRAAGIAETEQGMVGKALTADQQREIREYGTAGAIFRGIQKRTGGK
ncbi:MAG: hypothetical protein Q7S31_02775 [bacterium]|nr:hypothetical protein [bacterium]